MNVIEASGLGKRYGGTWALRDCSLAIPAGHVAALGIPLKRKAGRLSGGQQAQLALTLALARRPRLLVLDEPVAMLDPVARHDFMATVLTAMADDGVSVVLSSHVLAELERVADYLILLSHGRVQVADEVDDLLAGHRMLTGPAAEVDRYAGRLVVHARLVAYAALAFATGGLLRRHYPAPLVTSNPNVPGSAWVVSRWWTRDGKLAFTGWPSDSLLARYCPGPPAGVGPGGKPKAVALVQCLAQHGYTQWTSYQPASRFWTFQ